LLKSGGPEKKQKKANDVIGFVRGVGKKTVISNSDAKSCRSEVEHKQGYLGRGNTVVVYVDRHANYSGQSRYCKKRDVYPVVLSCCG
jgi:hypothetical protein